MSQVLDSPPTDAGSPPLLEIDGLQVRSSAPGGSRPILHPTRLTVAAGETLGLVGESGSGKSMLARSVVQLLPRGVTASGSIRFRGDELLASGGRSAIRRVRGRDVALILQDPFTMLNPTMKCGAQVVELLRDAQGRRLGRARRRAEAQRRLAEVGIDDPSVVDAFPGELSGGMRQRVGIAAALALDPAVVIADEPTTALDVTTQRDALNLLRRLQRSRGMSLILITHDLRVAFSVCDRIAVMYAGRIVEQAPALELAGRPLHPYTAGLLDAEPPSDRRLETIGTIPGIAARADEHPGGCAFAPRCAWREDACARAVPLLTSAAPQREVACWRSHAIAPELARAHEQVREQTQEQARDEAPWVSEREPLLLVEGLRKTFGSSRRQATALADVDLVVGHAESVGVVGESGSGKSTLARCVLGLETADQGRIVLDGLDTTDTRRLAREQLATMRGTVQMVFQDPQSTLNPARSVRSTLTEAVAAGGRRTSVSERVRELMAQVGLPEKLLSRRPSALSGGQRQRVAIARALAVDPRLLVCDEAVSALDVSVQAQILNLLNQLRRDLGISILFITHDLAVVRQVTDRVYVMNRGSVVEAGQTPTVLDEPGMSYTRHLLAASPSLSRDWLESATSEGIGRA